MAWLPLNKSLLLLLLTKTNILSRRKTLRKSLQIKICVIYPREQSSTLHRGAHEPVIEHSAAQGRGRRFHQQLLSTWCSKNKCVPTMEYYSAT